MKCFNCKAEIPDESIYCLKCGAKQPELKVCGKCGAKGLPTEALFCPHCGEIMNVNSTSNASKTSSSKNKSKQQQTKIILPIEKELPDYDDLRIGDFFYTDGTTSHVQDPAKKVVGRVFSLQTTKAEQQHGWTHGQILAVKEPVRRDYYEEKYGFLNLQTRRIYFNSTEFSWGSDNVDLPTPHKKIEDLKEAVNDRDGYLYTYSGHTNKKDDFEAFNAVRKFKSKSPLPQGLTSGWYLPALGQLLDIFKNLGNLDFSKYPDYHRNAPADTFEEFDGTPLGEMIRHFVERDEWSAGWLSSSEKDNYKCWNICNDGVDDTYKYHGSDNCVHPVAAF